ncbi:hypothetical protein TCDM_04059 [Trypanosoma cruzi Dm28c]|uniref:Uncharacterized protein n=1 Tax=Trypanosoma cruzi Dm28c TaxID=1416333 RepID=V5DIN2_TRYCR|nr:hypothetical protein TCDM_04059 [Trypanosoma cruzi Dm28c]
MSHRKGGSLKGDSWGNAAKYIFQPYCLFIYFYFYFLFFKGLRAILTAVYLYRRGRMHPRVAKLYLEFMLLAPTFASASSVPVAAELGRAISSAQVRTKALSSPGRDCFLSSTATYRARVQEGFTAPPVVAPGTPEFARRLARGRWTLRQLQDMIAVKKYRAMHKRYGWASQKSFDELSELFGETQAREMIIGLGNKEVFGFNEAFDDENDHLSKESGGVPKGMRT